MCLSWYGDTYEQRDILGLTITVARQPSKTVSELSFLTAVHTAMGIGKQEGISTVFAANNPPAVTHARRPVIAMLFNRPKPVLVKQSTVRQKS